MVTLFVGVRSAKWVRRNNQSAFLTLGFRDRLFGLYGHFPEDLRLNLLEEARSMFAFGYDSYMNHAFPFDELDPINCKGNVDTG